MHVRMYVYVLWHMYIYMSACMHTNREGGEGERERWFRLLFWAFRVSKFRVLWLRVQGWTVFAAVGFRAVGGVYSSRDFRMYTGLVPIVRNLL